MAKRSDNNMTLVIMAIFAIFAIGAILVGTGVVPLFGITGRTTGPGGAAGVECPDDGQTTLTVTAKNLYNISGTEEYDNTMKLFTKMSDGSEDWFADLADTTAGTDELVCGNTYVGRILSVDGDGGDSGKVLAARASGTTVEIIEGGKGIEFLAQGAENVIKLDVRQHAVLELRGRDNDADGFMFNTDEASGTYVTTGGSFESIVNGTALAVGSGGQLDLTFGVRIVEAQDDQDFSDFGAYFLADFAKATWNKPSVAYMNVVLPETSFDASSPGESAEEDLWSATYEYIYNIDNSILGLAENVQVFTRNPRSLDLDVSAKAGVDPSTDPTFAFAAVAATKSVTSDVVRYSGATDASTAAAVYTVQSWTVDLS